MLQASGELETSLGGTIMKPATKSDGNYAHATIVEAFTILCFEIPYPNYSMHLIFRVLGYLLDNAPAARLHASTGVVNHPLGSRKSEGASRPFAT